MREGRKKEAEGSIVSDILFALKRNIILVLAIIIVGGCCGIGYAYVKKPNYTAAESVIYKAEQTGSKGGMAADINIMRAYFNTIIDFCDEGVVTDRANYYYVKYQNENTTIDEFLKAEEQSDNYDSSKKTEKGYILKDKISTSVDVSSADSDQYPFVIKYTDEDKNEASIKAKLVVFALQKELSSEKNVYFDGIDNQIIELGSGGVSSDVSKTKLALIGAVLGAIVAAIIVYVKVVLDKTVTSKESLEALTGTTVLSVIAKEGGRE